MVAACPFPWPRGTPIRIHRMAEALGRRGHDVHVVTYHLADRTPTPSITVHRIAGPRWYTRTAPGPTLAKLALLDPLLTFKLRGLLRTMTFDVIHAHHYEGLLAALCARAGRSPPIVFDSHTLLETELPHYGYGLEAKLHKHAGRVLDRRLPARAEHVVAVSDDMRAHYEAAGHPSSRITVIGNGVEVEHFRPKDQDLARRPPADLCRQSGSLSTRGPAARGLCPGAPSGRARPAAHPHGRRLRAVCTALRAPRHWSLCRSARGRLSRTARRTSRATVLANPRIDCSGIPQKLLNYMASGTPVVSFAGSAKLLTHERSGLVVPDADVTAFAAAVLRLMADADLRRRLGACAQDLSLANTAGTRSPAASSTSTRASRRRHETGQGPRVALLGIDAAESTLVQSMIARGKLPTLAALHRQGSSGALASPADLYSGAVWPTFYSGQRPAWHGIYHNKLWQPRRMCCIVPDSRSVQRAAVLGSVRRSRHSQLCRRCATRSWAARETSLERTSAAGARTTPKR